MQGAVASEGIKGIRQVVSREPARHIGTYEYSRGSRDLASMTLQNLAQSEVVRRTSCHSEVSTREILNFTPTSCREPAPE
jgi:hypothetical protein